jgi:spermidine synthase
VELVGPVLSVLGDVARQDPQSPAAALLDDPRVRLVQGDGRRLLAASPELYDIIEADAIRPDTSHSGMLYSKEFMEQARRRLAPGGLFVQWAPTRRVVATFTAVFPYAVLLRPGHILIGSDRPIQLDLGVLAHRLSEPAVLAHFQRGNSGAAAGVAPFVAERALLWEPKDRRGPAPLTDMFPRDEFFLNNHVDVMWR